MHFLFAQTKRQYVFWAAFINGLFCPCETHTSWCMGWEAIGGSNWTE